MGATLVVLSVGMAVVGPTVAPYDPDLQHDDALDRMTRLPAGPSATYRLGADAVGRDTLSRLLYGGRGSLEVALLAAAIAFGLGTSFGLIAGFFGGAADGTVARVTDVILSLPFLLVAIAIHRVLDNPSAIALAIILGCLSWTTIGRIVRTRTLVAREMDYVAAARATGATNTYIIARHILPNVVAPAVVSGTTLIAAMLLTESAMSFLGLGVRAPTATWGSMLFEGQQMITAVPRLVLIPGVAIVATVFGFNLLGEALRDALDPES